MKSFKSWIKKRKLRLLLSLAMLIGAIVLGLSLDGFTGPESEMWQRLVYIVCVIGTGLSALAGAFLGTWGFMGAYGFVLIIALPQALPQALPEPYNRYFSFLYILGVLVVPHFLNKKREKSQPKRKKTPKAETGSAQPGGEGSFSHTSILAANVFSGRQYQLIRSGGMVYVYHIGGELRGMSPKLIQSAGKALRPMGKKDFSFAVEDIVRIRVKDISNGNSIYHYKTTVKTTGKTYTFWSMTGADDERIPGFWQSMSHTEVLDADSRAERSEPASCEKRLALAQKLKTAYCAYLIIVSLAWLFLDVPYALFSVLNLLGLPAIMVIYFLFQDEMTVLEAKKSTRKASIAIPFALSGAAVTLRTLIDFNILGWGRFFLCAGVCSVIFAAVFLLCSKEWKKRSSALGYLAAAIVLYCFCAPMQLNYILDNSKPTATEASIIEMWVSTGSKSPDTYNLRLETPDGTETTLEVGESQYESFRVGDGVDILTYSGFFGISYAFVE